MVLPYLISTAKISECTNYRYHLHRLWDASKPNLMYIGLNPSKADANQDDPTIRRCVGFARDNGFGGLYMMNLFAFRSIKPKNLLTAQDPVGPENDWWLDSIQAECTMVLFCWGAHKMVTHNGRDRDVEKMFPRALCLGRTAGGFPRHPLFVSGLTQLEKYQQ